MTINSLSFLTGNLEPSISVLPLNPTVRLC